MKDWRFLFEKFILQEHRKDFPEPEVLKVLRQVHGEVFVDIGANVGIYSTRLGKNFDRIFAFEPNPDVLPVLKANLDAIHHDNWTIFDVALSERKGRLMLYRDPHKGFTGSADTILPIFEYKPSGTGLPDNTYIGQDGIEVPTDTYDNVVYVAADLVKIDIEGAEFLVLEGMKQAFAQRRVRRIMVELHNRERKNELESLLSEKGFVTRWLDPDRIYGEFESVAEYRTI